MTSGVEDKSVIFSEGHIAGAVERIAAEIAKDYSNLSQLVLVGVMKGAICFLRDLKRELGATTAERIQVATARMETHQGQRCMKPKVIRLPSKNRIKARDLIIVDDIVATGATCALLKEKLMRLGAKSVKICPLLVDSRGQKVNVEIDYYGFKVPHPLMVGYGLDIKGEYRSLPYIKIAP